MHQQVSITMKASEYTLRLERALGRAVIEREVLDEQLAELLKTDEKSAEAPENPKPAPVGDITGHNRPHLRDVSETA